jgi:hypothetical protein
MKKMFKNNNVKLVETLMTLKKKPLTILINMVIVVTKSQKNEKLSSRKRNY